MAAPSGTGLARRWNRRPQNGTFGTARRRRVTTDGLPSPAAAFRAGPQPACPPKHRCCQRGRLPNRDSSAAELAAETIVEGQQDALDHAKATVAVRSLSAADIAAARDNPEPVALKLGVPVVTFEPDSRRSTRHCNLCLRGLPQQPVRRPARRSLPRVVSDLSGMRQLRHHASTLAPTGRPSRRPSTTSRPSSRQGGGP